MDEENVEMKHLVLCEVLCSPVRCACMNDVGISRMEMPSTVPVHIVTYSKTHNSSASDYAVRRIKVLCTSKT
jgi:phosphoribosylcarboxyaminoimidazole (NCAIR) mutase